MECLHWKNQELLVLFDRTYNYSFFKSIDSLGWGDCGELLLVQSVHVHGPVLDLHLSSLQVRHPAVGVHHEVFIISFGVVVSGMGASGLPPHQS